MAGIELYASRKPSHRRTWTAAAIPLSVIFIIIGQLMAVLLAKVLRIDVKPGATGWFENTYILLTFGFIILVIFLWVWLFERRGMKEIGFNGKVVPRYLGGLLIGFGFLAAVVCSIWALGGYQIESAGIWTAPSLAAFLPLLALFAGFMIQGATEETAMRGWLMQVVASRHGVVWAIIVNMIVFSLLHAGNIKPSPELAAGLANIVLVAILLSLYAIQEGSLWGVCAWHTAWNWLLGVGFGLKVSGETIDVKPIVIDLMDKPGAQWWLTGGNFGPEGSVVTTVILSLGVIFLLWKGAYKASHGYSAPLLEVKAKLK